MSFQPTLRRNQLIAPFGVGAIHVLKGSRAVVTAGLDFWFREAKLQQLQCVRVREPRLEAKLGVSHFRLPPGPETELKDHPKLEIPLFRFPTWYVCPRCNRMERRPLGMDGDARCPNEKCRGEVLRQISFAAVCDHGHLQDFPWKEWLRRDKRPPCLGQNCEMRYKAGGSGALGDISVECASCGMRRNLAGIMSGVLPDKESNDPLKQRGTSTLSSTLLAADAQGDPSTKCPEFLCQAGRVWLGESEGEPGEKCARPLRAVLINATNVHYAQIESALWIPSADDDDDTAKLRVALDRPEIRNQVKLFRTFNLPDSQIAQNILQNHAALFPERTEQDILQALSEGGRNTDTTWQEGLDSDEITRFPEYKQLQTARIPVTSEEPLEIRTVDTGLLPAALSKFIDGISLIDKLRETRVYRGFNRLVPQHAQGSPPPHSHLWKQPPFVDTEKWLPCSVVYGEGIFIRLKHDQVAEWEMTDNLVNHIAPLQAREDAAARRLGRPARPIRPRFLLLHTLAHLLIRRLVFECGYGSASLRERLYVSEKSNAIMSGILIYTASGDCEGSMGGLVRLGQVENFTRVFKAAIEDAAWCSADPVCTESGTNGGQGIDGLNVAACHCCTLLPETACELFNCYLDRSVVADFLSFTRRNQ
jgi:hypothetical protein